ncbi:unnamed protein product [Brassica rapa subsp. trilocularis]
MGGLRELKPKSEDLCVKGRFWSHRRRLERVPLPFAGCVYVTLPQERFGSHSPPLASSSSSIKGDSDQNVMNTLKNLGNSTL